MEDTIQPFAHQQSIADEKHTTIEDEQQLREDLIQRATTRLRRRLLEESLSDVMEQIIKLQTHLETIRVDTQTTIGSLTNMLDDKDENIKLNRQMDILERRLRSHKADLDQLQLTPVKENKETYHNDNNSTYQAEEEEENTSPQPSASMSRLSSLSLMSSIFGRTQSVSSKATSIYSNNDESKYQVQQQTQHNGSELLTEEEKRDRRRRRVRNQRQRYEESLKSRSSCGDDDDCISQINGSEMFDYKLNYPTVEEDDDDAPFYDLSGKRSFHAGSFCGSVYCKEQKTLPIPQAHDTSIRRKRRHHQYFQQQQQQQYQHENDREYPLTKYHHRYQDDEDECLFDCHTSEISSIVMSDDTISTLSSFIPDLHHPLSPVTPPPDYNYYNENVFGSSSNVNDDSNCHCYHMQNDKNNPSQPFWSPATMYDSWALENLSNDNYNNNINRLPLSLYPQRNVLDDAISFLDGLGENDDDGGLREDMCLLLQNPELCCRPLSEIQSAMDKLRLKESNKNLMHLMKPTTWIQLGVDTTVSAAYKTACTSLQWCKFLSVLSAAVVISLSKGPEDMKRSVY